MHIYANFYFLIDWFFHGLKFRDFSFTDHTELSSCQILKNVLFRWRFLKIEMLSLEKNSLLGGSSPWSFRAIFYIVIYFICDFSLKIQNLEVNNSNSALNVGMNILCKTDSLLKIYFWKNFDCKTSINTQSEYIMRWMSRARPGFEPGTSRILRENHTPRPTSHVKEYFQ